MGQEEGRFLSAPPRLTEGAPAWGLSLAGAARLAQGATAQGAATLGAAAPGNSGAAARAAIANHVASVQVTLTVG